MTMGNGMDQLFRVLGGLSVIIPLVVFFVGFLMLIGTKRSWYSIMGMISIVLIGLVELFRFIAMPIIYREFISVFNNPMIIFGLMNLISFVFYLLFGICFIGLVVDYRKNMNYSQKPPAVPL